MPRSRVVSHGWLIALWLWFGASLLGCDVVAPPDDHRSNVVTELKADTVEPGALTLPNRRASLKFAVIGDSGRGSPAQREVAAQMERLRSRFPFDFVLMLGDNIYEGPASAEDYRRKFEEPYAALLDAEVEFYAALGNHDEVNEVNYPPFNMKGQRYYSFAPPGNLLATLTTRVEFFALDTSNPDSTQLAWLAERLASSKAAWKICFFHHPVYTSGRYRYTSRAYRGLLEPLLVRYGVDVAFSGHEHIYQRSHLQYGVQYFVSGGAGSTRLGDGVPSSLIARSYSQDLHFMLVEIDGDELHFQAVSRTGVTIDAGVLSKRPSSEHAKPADTPTLEQSRSASP